MEIAVRVIGLSDVRGEEQVAGVGKGPVVGDSVFFLRIGSYVVDDGFEGAELAD